ncbi:arylsulfatase B [Rhipicephalus sanguineus]|uniref:arylsulfatase B n=1 Tax=Rhipicephalus sanguineus TaxID=34632 RepID=UPI00189639E2|nr:arylsulfatase B [Rhipicephalus sanguineus]
MISTSSPPCLVGFYHGQHVATNIGRHSAVLFLSHQGIHATCDNCTTEAPRENTDKFAYIEQHNRTVLAGALDVLDESVGQVLAALQQRDMLARSVVVFASDNGAAPLATVNSELPNGGNNWPLRGTKEGAWEGGVRTTALLWSASLRDTLPRPPSQQLMHTVDWGPTLYAVAGGNVSELGDVDGSDLWYELSTGKGVGRSEALLQLGDRDELSAIISGRYKLIQRSEGQVKPLLDEHVALPKGLPPAELDLDALMRDRRPGKHCRTPSTPRERRSMPLDPLPEWREQATVQCNRKSDEPGKL